MPVDEVLREVIETQGLFSSLYTDQGSHHWYREKAGGRVDKTRLTQVHRVLQQLGVTLMPANSPEVRGRSKRAHPARNGSTHGPNVPPIIDPSATVRD